MADPITITYAIVANGFAPNNCQGSTTYQSQAISAHGSSWADAKANVISRCQQLKGIGAVPADDIVDLDAL